MTLNYRLILSAGILLARMAHSQPQKIETEFGPAYMHSGDAIGYFASMVYFPEQEVTITWAVNGNYGKVDQFTQSKDAMNKIFEVVLE
jgi:D-alanyl-D-alanine carboxypeptidase